MVTRFRIETEDPSKRVVEDEMERACQQMLKHLGHFQPEDQWELVDEYLAPEVDDDEEAIMHMRRVFRRMQ